jgi:hypothetical protein
MKSQRYRVCLVTLLALAGAAIVWTRSRPDAPNKASRVPASEMAIVSPTMRPLADPPLHVDESGTMIEERDWNQRYRESTDYFSLARALADAAVIGDARAPYVLSRVLLECKVHAITLQSYPGGTAPERVQAYLVNTPSISEAQRAAFARRASQCERLFSENAFAEHDLPEEAQEFRYWRDLAIEAGDPLALMERATRTALTYRATEDSESASEYRDALFKDLRVAVASREPEALLLIGGLLVQPSLTDDPEVGLAWWAAACQTGYDCSNTNPDVGRGCVEAGTCEPGLTVLDTLQRDLGATKYAAIYAAGQDILYKVGNEDWDGLQQYLKVK